MQRAQALGFTASAVAASIAIAYGIVYAPTALALTLATLAVAAAVSFAPLKWLGTAIIFGLLTTPLYSVGAFLPADIAIVAALMVATVRGKLALLSTYPRPWLAFLAWAVLVTGLGPELVPLVHTFAPVAGGYLVACMCGPDHMWRAVRWWAVISICTAPVFVDDPTSGYRWTGLPGGPTDLGLIAAALIILAYAAPPETRWRLTQIAIGFGGLAATFSVSGGFAAIVGVTLLRRDRLLFKLALVAGVVVVLTRRPDLFTTLDVHAGQASTTVPILEDTNWFTGGGWLHGADYIATQPLDVEFYNSVVLLETVHNVYLQLLTDTGMIGLGLFLAALLWTWRRSERTSRAVLAAIAVWLNTTGAYPSAAWGLMGLVVAATAWSRSVAPLTDSPGRSPARSAPTWSGAPRIARSPRSGYRPANW
jgi:hypothetical protein